MSNKIYRNNREILITFLGAIATAEESDLIDIYTRVYVYETADLSHRQKRFYAFA